VNFVVSFFAGALIGVLYVVLRVKSPAPPVVALFGLFGMWVSQALLEGWL
jgi:XapX domain-containing protein